MKAKVLLLFVNVIFWSVLPGQNCSGKNEDPFAKDGVNLAIAKIIDKAGDMYTAEKYLLQAKNEEQSSATEVQNYLDDLNERRAKAMRCLSDLQLQKAVALSDKKYPRLYFQKGVCLGLLGKNEEALGAFTTSINLKSNQAVVFVRRGLLFERMGDLKAAQRDLEQAVHMAPRNTETLLQWAFFLIRRGRVDEARTLETKLQSRKSHYARAIAEAIKQGN